MDVEFNLKMEAMSSYEKSVSTLKIHDVTIQKPII
jgi:hypothetical protein